MRACQSDVNIIGTSKINLDDMEVMFPESKEKYEDDSKEMLIAKLRDRDKLIEKLWFEVKAYREIETLWKFDHNLNIKIYQAIINVYINIRYRIEERQTQNLYK